MKLILLIDTTGYLMGMGDGDGNELTRGLVGTREPGGGNGGPEDLPQGSFTIVCCVS